MGDWVDPNPQDPPPQHQDPPPKTETPTTPTSPSTTSSSSGSSAPAYDSYLTDEFKQDPVARQKATMFASAYSQLWAEPASEAYIIKAVKTGMNVTEFIHHERMKQAFQDTKAYKDESKGLRDAFKQMQVI